jgi:hypothetical protein
MTAPLDPHNMGRIFGTNNPYVRTLDPSTPHGISKEQGATPTLAYECVIEDVDTVTWMVRARCKFDGRSFPNVQIAQPYMNPNFGEGMYALPEIGSKCIVWVPSDSAPFILGYISPMEVTDTANSETPGGTSANNGGGGTMTASFAGGRTRAKNGDIYLKGRDGNFVTLHRGGILQIGASPLAQRIFIPLGNLITDICQNYSMYNSGGSINWGIREIGSNTVAENTTTYRVYANNQYGDIRVKMGKCSDLVPEPVGDAGDAQTIAGMGILDADSYIEMVIAPNGFESDNGQKYGAQDKQVLRLIVDKQGGVHLRSESAIHIRAKKRIRIDADDGLEFNTKKSVVINAEEGLTINGGKSTNLGTKGGTVVLNAGGTPVALVGSVVKVPLPNMLTIPCLYTPGPAPGIPGVLTIMQAPSPAPQIELTGVIDTGNPNVLA